MCIWKCAEEDRKCEYCCYYGGCEDRPEWEDGKIPQNVFEAYYYAVCEAVHGDVLVKSRVPSLVWGRFFLAYKLRRKGYTVTAIGRAIRRHHATVIFGVKQVQTVLRMPNVYKKEIELWNKFELCLKNSGNGGSSMSSITR